MSSKFQEASHPGANESLLVTASYATRRGVRISPVRGVGGSTLRDVVMGACAQAGKQRMLQKWDRQLWGQEAKARTSLFSHF